MSNTKEFSMSNLMRNVGKDAIIRLKRPLEDSPSDTLILNYNKKRKLDSSTEVTRSHEDEPLLTILKLTGTQNSQDEDISKHVNEIKKNLKEKFSHAFKKHNVDLNIKLRTEAQKKSKNSRYKVVNCLRSNVITDENTEENLIIYDLEIGCDENKADQQFVYDLYCTNTNLLDDVDDYNISIYPTSESLVFNSDEVYNIDEENDDSEDSNAENNWRNDYPDESEDGSINENDIIEAVRNVDLNDTLSSEDEFAYCTEENEEYDNEVDEFEGDKYGKMYAKFKAKYKDDSESPEEDSLSFSEND